MFVGTGSQTLFIIVQVGVGNTTSIGTAIQILASLIQTGTGVLPEFLDVEAVLTLVVVKGTIFKATEAESAILTLLLE